MILRDRCQDNSSELRLNHYPATDGQTLLRQNRISEHSDFGTVTILFQDSVGGLEIEHQGQSGVFVPLDPGDTCEAIINVGDCLQRWTNTQLRSANHRVTLPAKAERILRTSQDSLMIPDRYSIAYFGKPDRHELVDTLPEFCGPGMISKYNDKISSWEYNQSKLLRTY